MHFESTNTMQWSPISRWSGDVIARNWRENFIAVSHKAAARSRKSLPEWMLMHFRIILSIGTRNCAVCMRSADLEGWEVFQFDGESVLHLDGSDLSTWIAQHAALTSHCKLENHLVFYFNLLLIVYLLYSMKVTVFYRSLVCFYLVINFVITVCFDFWFDIGHSTSSVAQSIKLRSPTQPQTQDQVSRHRLFKVDLKLT